jgi:hypothetical protein
MTTLLATSPATLRPDVPCPDVPCADVPCPDIPCAAAARGLIERLSARISASVDEIAAFATADAALERIATRYLAGSRVVLAQPTSEAIAARAWSAARASQVVVSDPTAGRLERLVAAARDADVVVISSPVLSAVPSTAGGSPLGLPATIAPRELLLLRSRAPRPIIVLDLLEEEYARTPLTQPALLLPGTIVLRGFGRAWSEVGAKAVAPLAFVAGPADLVARLEAPALDPAVAEAACADLDLAAIDRAVRARVAEAA